MTQNTDSAIEQAFARRRRWRRPLMWGAPALLALAATYVWIFGGRYVSTEDAYIKADRVNVSAEVAAPVANVLVDENQQVSAGTPLLQLDRRAYEVAVHQAEAARLQVRIEIGALRSSYGQKAAALDTARTDLAFEKTRHARTEKLYSRRVVSRAALDDAQQSLERAQKRVVELQHDLAEVLVQLGGDLDAPIEDHPAYLAAQAALEKARLDLDRTTIVAPIDGVASKVPDPGTYAMPGLPLLSVVADRAAWIEANFKESELGRIRAGQPVRIAIDAYDGERWDGTVESIGQATGAEFSLLPPQNASGNWVKVVQRIPVRIRVLHQPDEPTLRSGMSADVRVDTGPSGRAATLMSWLGLNQAVAADR